MKYGFVKLVNDKGTVFMEPWQFDYYSNKEVFKEHAESLCIFDNVYIGCFPLLVSFQEIKRYNDDVKLVDEIPLYVNQVGAKTDINYVAAKYHCDNTR